MALSSSSHSNFSKKRFLIVGLLVIVLILVALELTNTTYIFHKKRVPATIPAVTQKKKSSKASEPSSGSSKSDRSDLQGDKIASSMGGGSSITLAQPYGDLVSNHFPGQNGSDTKEQSVCNTTPGAKCYIQFTNIANGKVTKLPEQIVDNSGTALWNWDAKTLTSGKWQIKAFASLNGQTRSATDSIELEIR